MVDTSNTHKKNGLVQKSFQLYNTGFRITVSIATGVCGESSSISIYDSNLYADEDSRSGRLNEYIIPVDDVEDLNELADMLKSCVKKGIKH